jgi:hypothetical protein
LFLLDGDQLSVRRRKCPFLLEEFKYVVLLSLTT